VGKWHTACASVKCESFSASTSTVHVVIHDVIVLFLVCVRSQGVVRHHQIRVEVSFKDWCLVWILFAVDSARQFTVNHNCYMTKLTGSFTGLPVATLRYLYTTLCPNKKGATNFFTVTFTDASSWRMICSFASEH